MLHASTMKRSGIAQDSIQIYNFPFVKYFFAFFFYVALIILLYIVWFANLFFSSVYDFLWILSSLFCVNASVLQSFENQVQ